MSCNLPGESPTAWVMARRRIPDKKKQLISFTQNHIMGKVVSESDYFVLLTIFRPNPPTRILQWQIILTHWGRVIHMGVSRLDHHWFRKLACRLHGQRQAIIWTSAGILLIRTLGTNLGQTLSESHLVSFKKMQLNVSSAKHRPFCPASMC